MRRPYRAGKLKCAIMILVALFSFSSLSIQAFEYVVKPGDNLETISRKYGVPVRELAELNGIRDIDLIRAGSVLEIPAADPEGYAEDDTRVRDDPYLPEDEREPSSGPGAVQYGSGGPDTAVNTTAADRAERSDAPAAALGSSGKTENTISVNVVDADIRDVLSALSLSLGRNIVFKGTPSDITLKISDVAPEEAFGLAVRVAGLIYVEAEDMIIVGDRGVISSDFADHVEIAEFRLKYITAETLAEQIMTLGLRVESLSVRSNSKALWVQGFASDLVKIRQIIRMLDKNANVELGSAEIGNCFRPIYVEYISAKELQSILTQLSLPSGFTLEGNPHTLYVYASNEDFATISSVKSVVDVVENYSLEGSYFTSQKVELYRLRHITADSVISLFDDFSAKESALDISVIYTNGLRKAVWLCGTVDAISDAKSVISAVDIPEMDALSRVQVFRLYNVTASEMERKLKLLTIPEMTVYTFPYSAFSKSILISCPGDYMDTVSEMIDILDRNSPLVTLPVDSSDVQDGSARLHSRRILISELSGIPISSFKISSNIAKGEGYRYVMYLTASPEEIQRVRDLIAEIDGV